MGFSMPFFPMYAAETLADGRFQGWTLEERGAWITLLCCAWNDGSIPASQTEIARLIHVTDSGDMARLWSAIGSRFSPAPGETGRLVCPRLENERDKAQVIGRIRANAGRKGANSRWSKAKSTHGKRMRQPSSCHAPANAVAIANDSTSPPPSPSHTEAASAQATIKPLGVHLQGQCPDLAALLARATVPVEVGTRAALWGEADGIVRQVGADAVLSCWAASAAKRGGEGAVPLAYLIHPMRDLAKRPAGRGPQPVSQDFSKTLDDVAREMEAKHGRPA
jgi:hypothetical protein